MNQSIKKKKMKKKKDAALGSKSSRAGDVKRNWEGNGGGEVGNRKASETQKDKKRQQRQKSQQSQPKRVGQRQCTCTSVVDLYSRISTIV